MKNWDFCVGCVARWRQNIGGEKESALIQKLAMLIDVVQKFGKSCAF